MEPMIAYNQLHGLWDVRTADGALLGAVPDTPEGRAGAMDALVAYLLAADDTAATCALRLRVARQVIASVGGVPATPQVRASAGTWETAVRRYMSYVRQPVRERERAA